MIKRINILKGLFDKTDAQFRRYYIPKRLNTSEASANIWNTNEHFGQLYLRVWRVQFDKLNKHTGQFCTQVMESITTAMLTIQHNAFNKKKTICLVNTLASMPPLLLHMSSQTLMVDMFLFVCFFVQIEKKSFVLLQTEA